MNGVVGGPDVHHSLLRHRPSLTWDETELPDVRRAYVNPNVHRVLLVGDDRITKPPHRGDSTWSRGQRPTGSLSGNRSRPAQVVIDCRALPAVSIGRGIPHQHKGINSLDNGR